MRLDPHRRIGAYCTFNEVTWLGVKCSCKSDQEPLAFTAAGMVTVMVSVAVESPLEDGVLTQLVPAETNCEPDEVESVTLEIVALYAAVVVNAAWE